VPNSVQADPGAEPVGGALVADSNPSQEGFVEGRGALSRPRGKDNNSGQACPHFVSGERIEGKPKVCKFPLDGLVSDKSYVWIMLANKGDKDDANVSTVCFPELYGNYTNVLVTELLVRPTLENPMTESKAETNSRSNLIWAALLLLMCADSLFWPPFKPYSAIGYLAWSSAFAIKGFQLFESHRWASTVHKLLTVIAVSFLVFSMARRFLA